MKKKFQYVAGRNAYEIELRPGFNKWWLLLLLLPLLLLIRLEKTVYVKTVYDNKVAVPGVSITFQYNRTIPFSDGSLLSDSLIVLKGVTDSSGVVKLEGLRYSVFSYIFKWGEEAMVFGESDCFVSDTALTRFHGLSDGGELILPMKNKPTVLDFKVVDKQDGRPLSDARVWIRAGLAGYNYSDSALSDIYGMVRFSGVPKCGKVELVYGSRAGFYPDSIVHRDVPALIAAGLDSGRTLRLKKFDTIPPISEVDRIRDSLGGQKGVVTITLVWKTIDDLDLALIEPDGTTIYYGGRISRNGGRLDIDKNAGRERVRNPIENIFYKQNPPPGRYSVIVNLYKRKSGTNTIPYELYISINGNTIVLKRDVSRETPNDDQVVYTFDYPG